MKLQVKLKQLSLVVALAALALTMGCYGTTPTATNEFTIVISASVSNTAFQPTITEAALVFDGNTAVDEPFTTPVALTTFSDTGTAVAGAHILAVIIIAQTSTPNKYTTPAPIITVYDSNGKLVKTIPFTSQTASLATGQAISYPFTL
jgi:hypothetical protein